MSVGAVNSQNSPLQQMLLSMLSRMEQAQFTPNPPASGTAKPASVTCPASSGGCNAGGGGSPQLGSDVLRVLMALQEQSGQTSNGTASDPAQQLFSALDTDGDGTVSQAEMESYIENQGGTRQQADALYSSLDPSGTAGITENQIASVASQSTGGAHGHHHHRHHGGGIADKAASDLIQAMDKNQDGTVDPNEFQGLVSQLGGSASEADQDYAALTSNGTNPLTASSLADALKTLDYSKVNLSSQSSPILAVLDAIGAAGTKPASSGTGTA